MEKISEEQLSQLNQRFAGATAQEILSHFQQTYQHRIAFATSMGAEDQVITHMMAGIDRSSRIFTLDTGRIFPETYDVIERTNARYGINIEIFFPEHKQVEEMVNQKGVNLFYESIENRKLCCHIRKIVPLRRALQGMDAWISGLRRSQAVTRKNLQPVEWDSTFGLLKINPLIDWTEEQVWDFINKNNIPYNRLHDQGFRSIGCQPCTRAIAPGDDVRAGRWWWETPEQKECGLHLKK
ncbi:MAG: phosphoadenylyl-sulfate reductase [Bacteroidales bacterium]|jgi:phosphoadenosine phosphosulfate reductase|nr:phosphoadenylyl-sulfate reductase [Bacteroidales bacterium]MDD2632576.1 phosphoadenylyl-sulfate reductase [Bacteroidales bacterium]MDD3130485.1 phosphoadenylyl-sulfate reductase [Bacteroidales bacterium]MDD3526097.1 phosphoadenylyl-sulfate reductase [Bacteroidales bacterium]MDD4177421.1 phosphoadenylyl-sulfate reductase [Bacteroidales bacterium]